jgi:predicted small lipoprotein YifL
MKRSSLVAGVVVAGVAVAISACGSAKPVAAPPATVKAKAPATTTTTTPAGYQRIGGAAQGVSFAVPASWVAVNFAQQTLQQVAKKFSVSGMSQSEIEQDMDSLSKLHAVYALDTASMASSADHFATNVSGYCDSSGVTDTGSAAVAFIRASVVSQLQEIHAHELGVTDVTIGGVPGVQNLYDLSTSVGTLEEGQLDVAPKPDVVCFITLTAPSGQFSSSELTTAASTAQFP